LFTIQTVITYHQTLKHKIKKKIHHDNHNLSNHVLIFEKNTKTRQTAFKILRLLTYVEKKLGQICESYDVINIFSKWDAAIPIRLFDKAYFSG
jgi:hypothetical protein